MGREQIGREAYQNGFSDGMNRAHSDALFECLDEMTPQERAKTLLEWGVTLPNILGGDVQTLVDKVYMDMYENEDEFILEMMRPYVDKIMERHIPKEVIKQAILTYSREHSEEMEMLMEKYRKEQE